MIQSLKKRTFVIILSIITAFAFMPAGPFLGADQVYAKTNGVLLENGDDYDITRCPKNTIIEINDSTAGPNGRGKVTLRGHSDKVWVRIELSTGHMVTVNLADGLTIKPGSDSAAGTGGSTDTLGHSRSAIYIDETRSAGGIVILKSEPNATITLDSYQAAFYQSVPAIMKNNTKTKLIFDTAEERNPGTIIAKPTSGGGTVAIGAFGHGVLGSATSSYTCGNIEFARGNIEAYGLEDGPGIGAYEYSNVGEILFRDAHVKAIAGNERKIHTMMGAAGIGTCYRGDIERIWISGGYVEAWGQGSKTDSKGWSVMRLLDTAGCGIGGGWLGHIGKIEISGGTVKAHGGTCAETDSEGISGCGIGTTVSNGVPMCKADEISITGGNIEAVGGDWTCGIGGCVKKITIDPETPSTELKIDAYIDSSKDRSGKRHAFGSGIGITNNSDDKYYSEYPGDIIIKGGDIIATAGYIGDETFQSNTATGAGIGPSHDGRVTSIAISGGTILAKGGWNAPGIGGPNYTVSDDAFTVDNIHITGGTIKSTQATFNGRDVPLSGIGGYKNRYGARTTTKITGGNVISEGTDFSIGYDMAGQPTNDRCTRVLETTFRFAPDPGEWAKVDSFSFDATPGLGYDYKLTDVYTRSGLGDESDDNLLKFWIPKDNAYGYNSTTITADRKYSTWNNSYEATNDVTLTSRTNITYVNPVTGEKYTGCGIYGSDKIYMDKAPPEKARYELEGYVDQEGVKVASGGYGNTAPSLVAGTDYVDDNGKWNAKDADLTLNMDLKQTEFLVDYKPNKPDAASSDVEGDMEEDIFPTDQFYHQLTWNEYKLKGWRFKGWNTKADGSGITYANGDNVRWEPDIDTITLYAQWVPERYTVTFFSGDSTDEHYTQDFEYDKAEKLTANGFTYEGHSFMGWRTLAYGSFYGDQAHVCNLCTFDENGRPVGKSLYAEWIDSDTLAIVLTDDEKPVTAPAPDCISLKTETQTMQVEFQKADYGYYVKNLPEGTYTVEFSGDLSVYEPQEKVVVTAGEASKYVWDYYTVTMSADPDDQKIDAKIARQGATPAADPVKHLYNGEEIEIHAAGKEGYHFSGYTAAGIAPDGFIPLDASAADQTGLKTRGQVDITAHAEANVYHVAFDGNKPEAASQDVKGTMETQDMVYGEPQNLFENGYSLTGWSFTGWNTKADGSGDAYADKASVEDLAAQHDVTVTLYVQWEPNKYSIYFSATNATSGEMEPQVLTYDEAATLTPNAYERTDWRFMDWNTEPAGGGETFEDGQEVINLTTGKSITLYAQWEHDYYTIEFDKNDVDATGKMASERVWTNSGYELPLCAYKKAGYHFGSWNTEADASGTRYENGEAVENAAEKGETVTLYAQWEPNEYTIKLDLNGGTLNGKKGTIELAGTYGDVIKLPKPARKGYKFDYWKGSRYYAGDKYTISGDHTLSAQWKKTGGGDNGGKHHHGDNPTTGDNSSPLIWFILMITAAAAIVILVASRRRNREE